VENHDCKNDPICLNYCTHCCHEFNVEVGERILELETLAVMREHPVITIEPVGDAEVTAVQTKIGMVREIPLASVYPFAIVKPHAMDRMGEIVNYLQDQGIVILDQAVIPDWADFSLLLYAVSSRHESMAGLKFRIARNKAFRQFEGSRACYLRLEKEVPFAKLYRIKYEIRRWFGEKRRVMEYEGMRYTLHSNAMHSVDPLGLEWANRVVIYWLIRKPQNGGSV
jgi:hypothetical protein